MARELEEFHRKRTMSVRGVKPLHEPYESDSHNVDDNIVARKIIQKTIQVKVVGLAEKREN